MAKAKPYLTVQVEVSNSDAVYAAECVTDILFDEYASDVFDMLGITTKTLRDEIMTFEPFRKMVANGVTANGLDALEAPYDYMDFDTVYRTKEWARLQNACEQMQAILDETERSSYQLEQITRAKETLEAAGFKVEKA